MKVRRLNLSSEESFTKEREKIRIHNRKYDLRHRAPKRLEPDPNIQLHFRRVQPEILLSIEKEALP